MSKETADDLSLYTREEMRKACRDNYNAALERAAQRASDMGYPDAACSIRDLKETP